MEESVISMDTPVPEVKSEEFNYVPDKFMVDGKPDYEKMATSYTNLERKLGTRLAESATSVDDYSYDFPEGFIKDVEAQESFKQQALEWGMSPDQYSALMEIYVQEKGGVSSVDDYQFEAPSNIHLDTEASEQFKQHAKELGLSQRQYSAIMEEYVKDIERFLPSPAHIESDLKATWGRNYDSNLNSAFDAAKALSDKIDINDIKGNTTAIKLLAMMGNNMREDNAPNTRGMVNPGLTELEVQDLMKRPDYFQNKAVQQQVSAYFQNKNR